MVSVHGRHRRWRYAVPTTREGGIWGTAGGVLDLGNHLLYAVGNGESHHHPTTAVTRSRALARPAADRLLRPPDWATQNAGDADLGLHEPGALVGSFVYADGKAGIGYVLHHDPSAGSAGRSPN